MGGPRIAAGQVRVGRRFSGGAGASGAKSSAAPAERVAGELAALGAQAASLRALAARPPPARPPRRGGSRAARANPRWVPDGEAPACMVCGAGFGLLHRRHHCRACGWLVCAGCSREALLLERWLEADGTLTAAAGPDAAGQVAARDPLLDA